MEPRVSRSSKGISLHSDGVHSAMTLSVDFGLAPCLVTTWI